MQFIDAWSIWRLDPNVISISIKDQCALGVFMMSQYLYNNDFSPLFSDVNFVAQIREFCSMHRCIEHRWDGIRCFHESVDSSDDAVIHQRFSCLLVIYRTISRSRNPYSTYWLKDSGNIRILWRRKERYLHIALLLVTFRLSQFSGRNWVS